MLRRLLQHWPPGAWQVFSGSDWLTISTPICLITPRECFPNLRGRPQFRLTECCAPLIYVSPDQINFQIPWEVPVGMAVTVQVFHDAVPSNTLLGSFGAAAPSAFSANGSVILACVGKAACTLWGNGFGFKSPAQQDGVPSNSDPLPMAVSP